MKSCAPALPGFRRRFRVTPAPGQVRSEVEDDFHCMSVVLHHDGKTINTVDADLMRAPWSTCPGATLQLQQTFTGVALDAVATRGDKAANCTHLHDLAQLAAAHAFDTQPMIYDVLVTDAVDGLRRAELRRDGEVVLSWAEASFRIVEPAELAGMTLDKLRPWMDTLSAPQQEAARLLRWANMIANGRRIPIGHQSDASRMPPNCYTFQPERAVIARRVGVIRDFNQGKAQPLDGMLLNSRV
ncbi:DUF2889 domain-containing protein [Hydrocarboniphaga sp.]|uniref:DUF2889 domain-containing protein n=1 Tax=Hydrocarboniphaga sp. TaxID=2033016 RepID=UPI003D0E31AA